MTRVFLYALISTCFAAPAWAQDAEPNSVTYRCDRDVEIPVVFLNQDGGVSIAVAVIENRPVILRDVIAASGARYRSGDDANGYQLWVKGDSATISVGEPDSEVILYSQCAVTP